MRLSETMVIPPPFPLLHPCQHWDGLLDVPPSTRILCVLGGYLGYKAGVILAAALTKDA